MRCTSLLSLVSILGATPIAAQGFEGVVSVKMTGMGNGMTDADWSVKGDKMVA